MTYQKAKSIEKVSTFEATSAFACTALGLFVLLITALVGCDEGERSSTEMGINDEYFSSSEMIDNLVSERLTNLTVDFSEALTRLESSVTNLSTASQDESWSIAQAAFKDTILAWEVVEVFQLGPLGSVSNVELGQSLRAAIYSYDAFKACTVDVNLVNGRYLNEGFIAGQTYDSQGLLAVEQLLFAPVNENLCPSTSPINREGSFAALAEEDRLVRRKAYLAVLLDGVREALDTIEGVWPSYLIELNNYTSSEGAFMDYRDVLEDLYVALFYVETYVKDRKLGRVLGLYEPCTDDVCPKLLELYHSGLSGFSIRENLGAFFDLYIDANAKTGFDAWVESVAGSDRATLIRDEANQAKSSCALLPDSLRPILESGRGSEGFDVIETCFNNLQTMLTTYKAELPSLLGVNPPMESASDTD